MRIEAAVYTHRGNTRANNEDNYFLDGTFKEDPAQVIAEDACERVLAAGSAGEGALTGSQVPGAGTVRVCDFAVCDGVGGASFGEVASTIAVSTLAKFHRQGRSREFEALIDDANSRVCREMDDRRSNRMGSTAALLHLEEGMASVCNVGDSRVYLYRDGILTRLSVDHRSGRVAGMSGLLTQHLGVRSNEFILEPYRSESIPLAAGQTFLLCSDGLSDMVPDPVIRDTVRAYEEQSAGEAAFELVRLALANGGLDNVTVMIVRILTR